MHSLHRSLPITLGFVVATAVLGTAAPPAYARDSELAHGAISLSVGAGDHYRRAGLYWESPSFWHHQFEGNTGHLDLLAEVGAAYWWAEGSRTPSSLWQLGVTPMLRWTVNDRFYLEAGVGPNLFSRTHFADKELSTAFQLGSHAGLGFFITPSSRIGLRYSHFSNAGLKRPNPGLNLLQLNYTYSY